MKIQATSCAASEAVALVTRKVLCLYQIICLTTGIHLVGYFFYTCIHSLPIETLSGSGTGQPIRKQDNYCYATLYPKPKP